MASRELQKKVKEEKLKDEKFKGIDGWLSVYVIYLIVLLLEYTIPGIFISIFEYFGIGVNGGVNRFIFATPFVLLSIYTMVSLYLIYTKRRIAIGFNIILSWLYLIHIIISIFNGGGEIPFGEIYFLFFVFPLLILAIVWTLYFVKSKRVKNTFVN